jgi:lipoate-protein ligase A
MLIRLLPFDSADGATNMAGDEVILETASEHGLASLRCYSWSEPTISLGYFQSSASRATSRFEPLAWVRRSTGGGGIVHHHELTYSFALPAGSDWKSTESWICRFHGLLQDVLAARGIESSLVACGDEKKLDEFLCFLHHTPGDLVVDGSKVAGSAQRKLRGALLQHGSMLLRASAHAPELQGLRDLTRQDSLTSEVLAAELPERFAAATGARGVPNGWTEAELTRLSVLRSTKYANREWNERR